MSARWAESAPMVRREAPPTEDELRRVRNHECRMNGHLFDELLHVGSLDPHALSCSHCGRRWPVGQGEGGAG